jgi:hypothetical protein
VMLSPNDTVSMKSLSSLDAGASQSEAKEWTKKA